jgi:nucleoside-diphosphate-sugar epimerase
MQAVVTGATGFVGSVLCRELHVRGWKIRALVLPKEDFAHIAPFIDEVRRGNIMQADSLADLSEGADVVFHLAARVLDYGTKQDFYGPIRDGTCHMLAASAGQAKRFVQVSSIAACGLGRHLKGRREEDPCCKSGVPYNDAKLDAEAAVHRYNDAFKAGCTIVRPANVVGPKSVWVDEVCRQLWKRASMPLIDRGRHSASLIYVDNLVDGIIRAGTYAQAAGQIYHLRDDWQVTWKRYLTDLATLIGKKPLGNISFSVAWQIGRFMEWVCTPLGLRPPVTRLAVGVMGRNNDVSNVKAKTELGWETRITYAESMERIAGYVATVLLPQLTGEEPS